MADLHNLYKDDPQKLGEIKSFESKIESAKKVIESSINTIQMNKHELSKNVTDRPDILQIIDKGKAKISKIYGPQPPPGTPPGANQKQIGHDHDGDGIPDH